MASALKTDNGTAFALTISETSAEVMIPQASAYEAIVLYNESDRKAHFRINESVSGDPATTSDRFLPPGESMTYFKGNGLVINAITDGAPTGTARLCGYVVQALDIRGGG